MTIGDSLFRAARNIFGWISDDREDEPNEEADATSSDATATSCEFDPTEREGEADEAEFVARDEINETFNPEPIVMVASPEDGMPVPANESADLAYAAPFTIDNVVCVEDERSYVELFADELEERGLFRDNKHVDTACLTPMPVYSLGEHGKEQLAMSVRSRYAVDGRDNGTERRTFEPDAVIERFGKLFVAINEGLIPVRPARERCRFYKRQCMAASDVPDQNDFGHYMLFRNCTMRRSVGGAFMTLRDEAVYACDYRDPPEPDSVEKHLDSRDRKRLASSEHLELIRPFNLADS